MHRNKTRAIIKEINGSGEVSCFMLLVFLVYQKMNNKNTEVAVINIYCNYLQQNGELILDILQETIQTIMGKQAKIRVFLH